MTFILQFRDGPATAAFLEVVRAPKFLRVVRTLAGRWDALDQLEDLAREDEEIIVYRLLDTAGTMHVDRVDPRTRRRIGTWHRIATYELNQVQPDQATARDTERWRAWCIDQVQALAPRTTSRTP